MHFAQTLQTLLLGLQPAISRVNGENQGRQKLHIVPEDGTQLLNLHKLPLKLIVNVRKQL
jgi:hypothetical protein